MFKMASLENTSVGCLSKIQLAHYLPFSANRKEFSTGNGHATARLSVDVKIPSDLLKMADNNDNIYENHV